MSEEIKWTHSSTNFYSIWTSDCSNYSISVGYESTGIAILADHSIENEPMDYIEHCKNFKTAKKLANLWKKGVFSL